MIFLRTLLDYALNGSSDMTMSRTWLSNEAQMEAYEAYTANENASAYVSRDSAWFRRKAFWDARERPKLPADVLPFEKRAYI